MRHYANRTTHAPRPDPRETPKPLVMWMGDDAEIGDHFVWHGIVYVVSAIYGTHLSACAVVRKCEKPKKHSDQGNGIAVPIDR